ncbi:hypothetical protein OIO90_004913 [Microbotryomycetes sp. JL221]|nr:hypothetical protein OIO90_004913 [Microbotryomycetes sp. JL221]
MTKVEAEQLSLTQDEVAKASMPGQALTTQECLRHASKLKDKVIVVTGAGSGFGRLFATTAGSHGAKLVLSDVNEDTVNKVVEEVKEAGGDAIGTQCDVTSWDSQVKMFRLGVDTFGKIDIVVPNAGVTEVHGWFDLKPGPDGEPLPPPKLTYDVNLLGVMYSANIALFHFRKNRSRDKKSIVFIGSMASSFPIPLGPMYSMAKHGVLGLQRSLHLSLSGERVRTNTIGPWFVKTGIMSFDSLIGTSGLPLGQIDKVIEAMILAASDDELEGALIPVDASGAFLIPWSAWMGGTWNYYRAFEQRAGLLAHITGGLRNNLAGGLGTIFNSVKGAVFGR